MRIDHKIENWLDGHSNIVTLAVIILICTVVMVVF